MTLDVITEHIVSTPDTLGGKPRIVGRRISVQDIVIWYERLGKSVDEIATDYDLSLADIHAALAYYHDHRLAIDAAIQADNELAERLRSQYPSKLKICYTLAEIF